MEVKQIKKYADKTMYQGIILSIIVGVISLYLYSKGISTKSVELNLISKIVFLGGMSIIFIFVISKFVRLTKHFEMDHQESSSIFITRIFTNVIKYSIVGLILVIVITLNEELFDNVKAIVKDIRELIVGPEEIPIDIN